MESAARDGASDLLIIEPSSPWRSVDLAEVWRYRELLFFFVWRDVKVRYKQTTLGILWAVVQPFLSMVVFAFVFGRVAQLPSDGMPYALFAYCGLLPWTFFANAVSSGSLSLVSSSHLLSKVYFPRILVPLSAVATGVVDFAIAVVMLIPLFALYRVVPSPLALFWMPVAALVSLLLAFGLSVWLSALVAKYRDLRHAIPFLVQLWMFATPIVYPLSMIPSKWRWLVALNPMTGVVEVFRRSVFARPIDVMPLVWSALLACALIASGSIYFRRTERMVADVL